MFLNSTTFILFKTTRHTSSASTPVQCTPAPLSTGATHEVQTYGVSSSTTNCLHSTTTTQHYTTHTMKLQQDQHEGRPQQHDSWHSTVGDTTRRVKAHAPPPPPPHQPVLIDSFLSTPISAHNCIVVSSYIVSSAGESQ